MEDIRQPFDRPTATPNNFQLLGADTETGGLERPVATGNPQAADTATKVAVWWLSSIVVGVENDKDGSYLILDISVRYLSR